VKCTGAIGAQSSHVGKGEHIKVYGCTRHHMRGNAVCCVKLRQAIGEVEASVIDQIKRKWITQDMVTEIMAELRETLTAQVRESALDADAIEAELGRLRGEQKNLASAVATGGDAIPELLSELRRRNERIRTLEIDLGAARRTPTMVEEMLAKSEANARRRVEALRELLDNPADARDVFESVFLPEGLEFQEGISSDGARRVWAITATAHPARSILSCDPTGT
jgi:hypothetical protein